MPGVICRTNHRVDMFPRKRHFGGASFLCNYIEIPLRGMEGSLVIQRRHLTFTIRERHLPPQCNDNMDAIPRWGISFVGLSQRGM